MTLNNLLFVLSLLFTMASVFYFGDTGKYGAMLVAAFVGLGGMTLARLPDILKSQTETKH